MYPVRRQKINYCVWHLQTELNFLKRFNHPNVVKLIGYCSEGDHSILVYEFMPKGSLEASLLKGKPLAKRTYKPDVYTTHTTSKPAIISN